MLPAQDRCRRRTRRSTTYAPFWSPTTLADGLRRAALLAPSVLCQPPAPARLSHGMDLPASGPGDRIACNARHADEQRAGRLAGSSRREPLADVVTGVGQPGPGPATLTLRGKRIPPIQFSGPARQHILKPPERSSPGNGDLQPVGAPWITHCPDEQLHVPVAVPRTLAVHPQPLVRIAG